ncbi:MAG: dethiobiotin synthase [Verrucomicrobiales bacterium]|nr:dethiobiotin synthase [Verrucomicrobiales bacterium]
MAESIFITGTDTGVGKTHVLCELLRTLRSSGTNTVGFKPVECGRDRSDSRAILSVCEGTGITLEDINPVYFETPVAPQAAAEIEGPKWELDSVLEAFDDLKSRFDAVIVEGAGGWLVPIESGFSVADLAGSLQLPVVVVAANRLGVLNHTLLTVNQIERDGLDCRTVILNDLADGEPDESTASNEAVLRDQLDCPLLRFQFSQSGLDLFG